MTRSGMKLERWHHLSNDQLTPELLAKKEQDKIDFVKDPTMFIKAAWLDNLSYGHEVTANRWDRLPREKQWDALNLFFFRLRKEAAERTMRKSDSLALRFAFLCLDGLGRATQEHHADPVFTKKLIETWPGICKWTLVLLQIYRSPGLPADTKYDAYFTIQNTWWKLSLNKDLFKIMVTEPKSLEIAVSTWLDDDRQLPLTAPASRAAFSFLQAILVFRNSRAIYYDYAPDGDCKDIHDLVLKHANGDADAIAETAIKPLRSRKGIASVAGLVALGTVVHLILHFGLAGGQDHPIAKAVRRTDTTLLLTQTLLDVAAVRGDGPIESFPLIFMAVNSLIPDEYEYVRLTQALRAGLLSAFADFSPSLGKVPEERKADMISLITDIIPRCMIHLPVVEAVERALDSLSPTQRKRVEHSCIEDLWENFVTGARQYIAFAHTYHRPHDYGTGFALCDNVLCYKMGSRKAFRRCSNCRVTYYCSQECQRTAWKSGKHKETCSFPKLCDSQPEPSKADNNFLLALFRHQHAQASPSLEMLAETEFPGIPFHHLIVSANYTKLPSEMTLVPISVLEEKYKDRNPAFYEILANVRNKPETHNAIEATLVQRGRMFNALFEMWDPE